MTIIYAILIFCVLIFVHEFGHFIAAKACGVKVNEFSIGMGPAFFKRQRGETLYSLRILPIGGFCAMEGEDEDSEDERAFNNKPAWQRAIVLAAGAFMNLLTAVILMIIIAFWSGQATTVIDDVQDNSPAYEAGLQAGDEIVAVDGERIDDWEEILSLIGAGEGAETDITVLRDGREMTFSTQPEYNEEAGRAMVGISARVSHNLFPALDGGRLLFLLIRKITGRRVTDEMEGKIHFIGIVLLMALMVYVTWNDIVRFIVPLFS